MGFVDGKAICCSAYGFRSFIYRSGSAILTNYTMQCQGQESDALHCLQQKNCTSGAYASVVCFNATDPITEDYNFTPDNPQKQSGMVAVTHYGVKGRICSTFWDDTNAKVFCKQNGYVDGIAYHTYSQTYMSLTTRGPYWISAMNCSGSENSLNTCSFQSRLSLGNCSAADIASAACFNDTTGIQYRLAGGGENYGRVEISVGGVWGTVCDRYWDNREAEVFCRQMGHSGGYAIPGAHYGQGSGPMWLSELRCRGTESLLHQCPHGGFQSEVVDGPSWYYGCNTHRRDASVSCVGKVKLNTGLNASLGAVEMYDNNTWKAVCDTGFNNKAARVTCKELGFADGVVIKGSVAGATDGPIGIYGVSCTGQEKSLTDCHPKTTGTCSSGTYASVFCSMSPIVDNGFRLRLKRDDTSADYHGFLQVNIGGVWGGVCMAGFDQWAAKTACKQLGFAGGVVYRPYGFSNDVILMTEIHCTGNEASLNGCPFKGRSTTSWCDYYAPRAGVLCYRSTTAGVQYRLTGDTVTGRGRVEMAYEGQWGAFCNPFSPYSVGRVACKSAGYKDGVSLAGARYGAPDLKFWFNYISCQGNETTLPECRSMGFNMDGTGYSRFYKSYCRSTYGPVAVQCYMSELVVTDVRLAGGTNSSGRVEVFVSGANKWGTVCDDYWDDVDATVVCNQLGFAKGTALKRASMGSGGGPIWMDNVGCLGNETRLQDCPHSGLGVHNCIHREDSGVICQGVYVPPTSTSTTVNPTDGPITRRITSTKGAPPAAIAVPVVLVVVAVAGVAVFMFYRRQRNKMNDGWEQNLSYNDPPNTGGADSRVNIAGRGVFFERFRKRPEATGQESSDTGVSNPVYDFAPDTAAPSSVSTGLPRESDA